MLKSRDVLLGGLAGLSASLALAAPPSLGYKLGFESRLAYHLFDHRDLASNRYGMTFEQRASLPKGWTLVGGFQAYVDAAYAANSDRYSSSYAKKESQDFTLRDLYLQYKSGPWVFRIGNQQVVWGETFSFFYADVVNPKDLREYALGELAEMRKQVPIVNARYLFNQSTLQLIWIPHPSYHQLDPEGGDFALPYSTYLPGAQVEVKEDERTGLGPSDWEGGIRGSTLIGGMDLSLFFFNYHDRFPRYSAEITGIAPLRLSLHPFHPRVQSFGFTATGEIGDLLLRGESVLTRNRLFDSITAGGLDHQASDEVTYVLEASTSRFEKWRFNVQWAQDLVLNSIPGSTASRVNNTASLHINRTLPKEQSLDLTGSYALMDRSALLMFRYLVPLASQLELKVGGDILLGSESSSFGMFHAGSRAFFGLRAYFSK